MNSSYDKPESNAALSDHRFAQPLDADDVFQEVPLIQGSINLQEFKRQAESHGAKRAHEAKKRYFVPTEANVETATPIADRILGLLVMSRYRRGPIQFVHEARPMFIEKIREAILADKPIELILSFFGSKVRNPLKTWATDGKSVDISEMASLLRFYEISTAIKEIYPRGAIVHVACDGRKYADAIGFSPEEGRGYYENLRMMCDCLGINDSVHLFDEADHYPSDIQHRTTRHLERVQRSFESGDVATVAFVTKLQTSMCLSMPIDTSSIDIVTLRYAFSCLSDEDLTTSNQPDALEIRRHLRSESRMRAMKYIAAYDAVKEACVIEEQSPAAIRATVHPKPGQLGLYAVNMHSNDVFPHHGQGVLRGEKHDIERIRVEFRADLERKAAGAACGILLNAEEFPFAVAQHPFYVNTERT